MKMNKTFPKEDRKFLENLAKNAVEKFIRTGKELYVEEVPESTKDMLACFVTIYKQGELRGCIGTLEPYDELYRSVIENAISAATRDTRFNSVEEEELDSLTFEISILTKPEKIDYITQEELFDKIRKKGVTLEKGFYRSTYLPQVWEHFTMEEDFLSSLCRKAGLNGNEWKKLNKSEIEYSVYDTVK
jgi:AmmeMemoRadiSam system protein A